MKTIGLFLLFIAFGISPSLAQKKGKDKKEDPDHKNFYKDLKLETDAYVMEITDAVAEQEYSKFKVKITNKTNDYLLFDGSQCVFKFDFGEYKPNERQVVIGPNESDSKVLNVKGDTRFHVESFTFMLNGLTRVPATGVAQNAPDFQLPPAVNDFKAGPFDVTLLKLKKETDNTVAQFRATYTGSQIGLLDPGKLGVRIESGQEFANAKHDYKTKLLGKGDDDKFNAYFKIPAKVVDMQFATMFIVWRNTFQESKKIPIKGLTATLELDAGKTAAMNK